jgi:predicted RNA binding protein YcfA (HicA-like mRNA interferase family)
VKLPRDVSGRELAQALGRLGFAIDHQTGSHIRLTLTRDREHHLTIPAHDPLKVGTLNAILRMAAEQLGTERGDLLQQLFG